MFKLITSRCTQHTFRKLLLKTCSAEATGESRNLVLFQQARLIQNFSRFISTSQPKLQSEEIEVTFVRSNGERIKAKGKIGDSLLDVVLNNELDLDGFGACEGTLTCSTCHLIFKKADYDALPDKPGDEELDMLDLAYDLTDTSRLGCQIVLTKNLNGLEVQVPATVNDARS
ncbi:adrenodoxin-like protein 2, mitochondrial [Wyeomyia smithii]|uniref:adrenodoxin-like protein 2, mitochondrial n=1 Tax=Wyeomyia smithii TaxID=174621 RepID=UPI002467CF3E|nr:adrenodoxin-like protein 2, mitochondrial [Wyeomyia smithii]XP_055541900.1 adrenodoxin-like protein 2, mitochondrial [Wyeomyia smithii]XP_055541902.1 adrenodoxin-like protein 2, mitochondrial [Wyeomyia smithii]